MDSWRPISDGSVPEALNDQTGPDSRRVRPSGLWYVARRAKPQIHSNLAKPADRIARGAAQGRLPVIRLEAVTKTYKGEVVALRDATAEIQRGEFVFLVGPSGSGKSTFLRLVNREELATAGKIMVAGKDVGTLSSWKVPYLRRSIGYVFQDYKLLPKKTVAENVAFALEVIGRPRPVIRRKVPAILDLVGLSRKSERFPEELSGGEQQRVAVARALANSPAILLADEPTGNLDPKTSEIVFDLLVKLVRERGMSALIATHNIALAQRMDRVVTLGAGKIQGFSAES